MGPGRYRTLAAIYSTKSSIKASSPTKTIEESMDIAAPVGVLLGVAGCVMALHLLKQVDGQSDAPLTMPWPPLLQHTPPRWSHV